MPRIADEELDRLKREVSLKRLMESQGYTLVKRGKDWAMRCVFHEEETASLVVSETKNLYHCFGCNAAGSVLDWVMKTQSVSLPHAVQILKEGGALSGERIGVTRSYKRHLPPLVASEGDDPQAELWQVVDYYHATLKQSPAALAYLQGRGLNQPEMIDHFKLGHANKTLTYRLPPVHTVGGKSTRARLQAAGILRESGHEHLNGCLVVPVIGLEGGAVAAHSGCITQLYGRRMSAPRTSGEVPRHFYLPRPLAGVWNEAALMAEKEIILCEALIDALTFWCAGYRNVIASFGVNGFTADHWQALKQHGTRRVMIAYDRDEAGNTAAEALAAQLLEAGIECFRVLFPKGMDANEYARKVQPAGKSLGLALREAQWLGKGQRPGVQVCQVCQVSDVRDQGSKAGTLAAAAEISSLAAPLPVPETAPTCAPVPAPEPEPEPAPEPSPEPSAQGELRLSVGGCQWRIRGWQKNLAPELMRVNLQVRREAGEGIEAAYYVDTLDLYAARQRAVYIKQAALELGMEESRIKRDLGQVLLKLEILQDKAIQAALSPNPPVPSLSASAEAAALAFLQSPELIAQLEADMARCGLVGETPNLLAGYLSAVSRKLDAPLAILIQSSSAAGKTSLMEALLKLMPEEERIQYSAMTGQSLYYLGERDLQHKILAIAEEAGVRQAAYALKLLQSEGELTIASTGKDELTGNLITKQYRVKGPVMLMLTTTAIDIDEELLNRCLVLTVNESRAQTQAIHCRQRAGQTLEGLLQDVERHQIIERHQNAQRLLKPLHVVNPYAHRLSFLDDKIRTRRDHMKYLTLIRAITLLHQHQRPHRHIEHHGQMLDYIEVTPADIALANRIAHEVLGRTLDELPPQTRRLLHLMREMVDGLAQQKSVPARDIRFTRRDVREATGWSDNQLKVHCTRLTEMEYLLPHGGSRGHLLQYELLYDGAADEPDTQRHLCGLIDPAELDNVAGKLASGPRKMAPGWPQVAPELAPVECPEPQAPQGFEPAQVGGVKNALLMNGASSFAAVV
jgi:DNA primase catalytic core